MTDLPGRSMLFVPASQPAMMAKAARSAADAVCLDLEDSVAPSAKATARAQIVEALRTLDFGERQRIVRVNAVDTPWTHGDVITVVEGAGDRIDALMVPKVGSRDDLRFVDRLLTQLEHGARWSRPIALHAQIESAAGFVHLAEIAASTPRLRVLVFGAGDYAASMGMPLTHIGVDDPDEADLPGHRWHAVMHGIVAAARAHGLGCWDGPYAAYKDDAGLRRACRIARATGFDGKQCIHPAQLATVNAAFSPTEAEVAHARAVVAAAAAAEAAGQGAAALDGVMIDAVNLRLAHATLRRHDAFTPRR